MNETIDFESTVSENRVNIPGRIRRELDIDDGDRLRWQIEDDGVLRVCVVQQRSGTFSDFDGYDGDGDTDVETEHDAWGVNVS
ncbi:AbrB/MazE/SpoVT family DNA-binding domain-containing protein [Halocalculus aciditolerans]|uniref:AbrB family transcriptional regulator n=1 Tax=Halocalculus aciditolerans TaxID=1383812 RepID=A0A830FEW1_9EURY|nr:AbrB/MazE/SpoVT family DNA-binding domain-containing protein [Halocalculus aciditolerans]GGL68161.1 AbrB family transcriptional regulator [Halocalculus aciditolerans]